MSERFSQAKAAKALKWAQKLLQLSDWDIELEIQDEPPEWLNDVEVDEGTSGMTWPQPDECTAQMWVSPERCRNNDVTPLEAIYHECGHLLLTNAGLHPRDHNVHWERVCNRVAAVLVEAYA